MLITKKKHTQEIELLKKEIFDLTQDKYDLLDKGRVKEKEIAALKEQVASLSKEKDDWESFYENEVKPMAKEAGEKVEAWQAFYEKTLLDIGDGLLFLDKLRQASTMVNDDPNIRTLQKVVIYFHDLLTEYTNAWKTPGTEDKKEQESK